ncbi:MULTISPECIES: geranylgeranylglycerol-phosphate geranylgeranyltransferase [unclassified Polaribacter]|jgi:4-hydroxybenzoate polyprenyltransferase|uniref:geranylgeranylglycerol-phosphate geranylgeranyltransferase n=1 Tax=unclassified Polaribacter TaxID=196858 RepID=UPI00052D84F6|nr:MULTISPECIES: geranylgeranylglycerol-phosphate geranylgeranyltransferase [unclassified Polaribacter]KGL61409.1 UbiA prenyltransferase family protein [Polaribacter sp. Hel1_33_49]MBT3742252.1 geranylgeranylglycerol-phosphate geranylgeranyltransferase [Polaribacter sp.]MDG1194597.1 geranylgeranylglycerol-phosphate geranylgeranyltransferase [Polaribacter sp.]MDG1403596.1 geranylgeranylglycerol-phosphate geranylgeranyltransferase [Polaribacter sp.]PKV65550.1 4-hydroxybenzoate polyprenyltransfer
MSSSKTKTFLKKIFSLLSVIRGYNILVLIIAQYLASIFIFSPKKSIRAIIFDFDLLYIVLASVCVVAAGYIINNFYDVKVDRINRPLKTGIDNYVKQETKLMLYFILNFLGFTWGLFVSWKSALFFSVYIFGIWLYSHKLKKHPFTGLISATILTILPFFAVFVYYKNFSKIIFLHAVFLFLVIMVRELIKDLENIKGALANNYKTFSVVYGELRTKQLSLLLLLLAFIPVIILFTYPALSDMRYYFYLALLTLSFVGVYLWKSTQQKQYTFLHNVLKLLLLTGVFCLVFIDTSLLLEKVIDRLN